MEEPTNIHEPIIMVPKGKVAEDSLISHLTHKEFDDEDEPVVAKKPRLPQKKYYRQRAHSNPICDHIFDNPIRPDKMDWSKFYPQSSLITKTGDPKQVEFLDVGCGYGGLLVTAGPLFPDTLMLGMEIRVKVSNYVQHRIQSLREVNPNKYDNIACIRTNAMKYLPNYFYKGQLKKMFFLYPDPHFKKSKYKWRIISDTLLSEYAYFLATGGLVYTVTDVKDLHEWMVKHFSEHPLFEVIEDIELVNDILAQKILDSTEEGKKVSANNGEKFIKVFRRIEAGVKDWSLDDAEPLPNPETDDEKNDVVDQET